MIYKKFEWNNKDKYEKYILNIFSILFNVLLKYLLPLEKNCILWSGNNKENGFRREVSPIPALMSLYEQHLQRSFCCCVNYVINHYQIKEANPLNKNYITIYLQKQTKRKWHFAPLCFILFFIMDVIFQSRFCVFDHRKLIKSF